MIPNDIIPSEPMRNAVTKTSKREAKGDDLATFLLWVAESYEAHALCADFPDEIEGYLGSAKMAREHLAKLSAPEPQPEVAAEPVAWSNRSFLVALLASDDWREAGAIWQHNPEDRKAALAELHAGAPVPRPLDEWQEGYGDVVWWCWRDGAWLGEAAYIGTPLDLGQTVEVELRSNTGEFIHQHQVGGWPGYHTHWTPHPAFPAKIVEAAS